jgi:hypothetical protein
MRGKVRMVACDRPAFKPRDRVRMFLPGCVFGWWRYPEMRIINIFLTEEEAAAAKWQRKWWRRRWRATSRPSQVAGDTDAVRGRKPDS